MSRWSEFGFPDLAGVPLGTALEGLFLAIMERHSLFGGYSERDETYNQQLYQRIFKSGQTTYRTAFDTIENALQSLGYRGNMITSPECGLVLENRQQVNLGELLDLLGEDYIEYPRLAGDRSEFGNFGFVTGRWLRQRYRMINCVYLGELEHSCWHRIRENCGGVGKFRHEALENLQEYDDYHYSDGASSRSTNDNVGYVYGSDRYMVSRGLVIPESFRYMFYKPSELSVEVCPERREAWSVTGLDKKLPVAVADDGRTGRNENRYYDFGLGLEINKKAILRKYEMPEDIQVGDEFSLKDLADTFVTGFHNAGFPDPYLMQNRFHTIELGINLNAYYRFDFRKYLDFYDPVEIPEKGE